MLYNCIPFCLVQEIRIVPLFFIIMSKLGPDSFWYIYFGFRVSEFIFLDLLLLGMLLLVLLGLTVVRWVNLPVLKLSYKLYFVYLSLFLHCICTLHTLHCICTRISHSVIDCYLAIFTRIPDSSNRLWAQIVDCKFHRNQLGYFKLEVTDLEI